MPSYPCHYPTCTAYVPRRGDGCPDHLRTDRPDAEKHRRYDAKRDPESVKFYHSLAWQHARNAKLAEFPVCERCGGDFANHVHHVKPLKECTFAESISPRNLMALCPGCHTIIEKGGDA